MCETVIPLIFLIPLLGSVARFPDTARDKQRNGPDRWGNVVKQKLTRHPLRSLVQLAGRRRTAPHTSGRWPQGMGMVGGVRWKSRRASFGRECHQVTNRTSCFTASS